MKLKKEEKGWILEELEKKKNECLESKDFGGEDPEEVEKQREEKDKEINKRFEGTKKNAEKVKGEDHEEKGKVHEQLVKDRKELTTLIKTLKEQNIKYTVKRSLTEDFRYSVSYLKESLEESKTLADTNGIVTYGGSQNDFLKKYGLDKYFEWDGCDLVDKKTYSTTIINFGRDGKSEKALLKEIEEYYPKIYKKIKKNIVEEKESDEGPEHGYASVEDYERSQKILDQMMDLRNHEDAEEQRLILACYKEGKLDRDDCWKQVEKLHKETQEKVEALFKELTSLTDKEIKDESLTEGYEDDLLFLDEPVEELPDAIPEEPIVVSTEDTAEVVDGANHGMYLALSQELRDTLQDIENLKSLSVTLVQEVPEDEESVKVLNEIIDERTIHVGLIQSLMDNFDVEVEASEEVPTEVQAEEEPVEESLNESVLNEGHLVQEYKGYEIDWNEDLLDLENGTVDFTVDILKDGKEVATANNVKEAREWIDKHAEQVDSDWLSNFTDYGKQMIKDAQACGLWSFYDPMAGNFSFSKEQWDENQDKIKKWLEDHPYYGAVREKSEIYKDTGADFEFSSDGWAYFLTDWGFEDEDGEMGEVLVWPKEQRESLEKAIK